MTEFEYATKMKLKRLIEISLDGGSLSDNDYDFFQNCYKENPIQYKSIHAEVKAKAMKRMNPYNW